MSHMRLNKDCSEIITYDEAGIPIYIQEIFLSTCPDYRVLCHWHEDIEFIYIVDGQMNYYVNGANLFLTKGDTLVINSKRLHYGYSASKNECRLYCIIFHPSLVTTNKKLMQKYISVITDSTKNDYLLFHSNDKITELLHDIYNKKINPSPSYELEVIGLFLLLWNEVYSNMLSNTPVSQTASNTELLLQRQMVAYICQNFSENLSLDDIAVSGNICRSKCCQIFKKYVGQSPIDFLNAYRLEYSRYLLEMTTLSVTDICTACGFNHLSYFSKQFKQKYGCTPKKYRNP